MNDPQRPTVVYRAWRKTSRTGRYLAMSCHYLYRRLRRSLPTPVFIVCQNRTGSTFLNRLFTEHPQCWTYTSGSHQEAMDHEDCPRWLSRQPFLIRWRTTTCSAFQRFQTRVWTAYLARGHRFGVFKIPHALGKVLALQRALPNARFILLLRHPAAQVASAIATGKNPPEYLEITADTLIRFLTQEMNRVRNLIAVRYEDLIAEPAETFTSLLGKLDMPAEHDSVARCLANVGVAPGRSSTDQVAPPHMRQRVATLCRLLQYQSTNQRTTQRLPLT